MARLTRLTIVLMVIFSVTAVFARPGRTSTDCQPDSKDPDCADTTKPPPPPPPK